METPEFISNTGSTNKGLDFDYLRTEGIKFIQELTGAFWTDYNEHDPGVTILEQLCYALTDLSYQVDFDIQDILFKDSSEGHTFHQPKEIFPSNPITVKDYRKLIIDQVKEVRNVWLLPTQPHENSLRGLYKVLVDLGKNSLEEGSSEISPEKEKQIIQQIKDVYCNHRNLCEDFEEIVVLEPLDVILYADIEIDKIEDIELILAKIYYAIDQHFNPEIHFYALQDLLSQGLELQEIYSGPFLKHGFIRNQDLHEKLDKIVISEIIKIIMDVEEVISVKNLSLKINDEFYDNQYNIAYHQVPRIIFGSSRGRNDYTLSFYKNNINHDNIQSLIFQRKLNEFKSSNKRVYREQIESVSFSQGKTLQLNEYYSVQNQFPEVYGIGEFGIPDKITPERNAQAKQLKGYLLLFEQIMANYLAQIAHVKELFSLEAQLHQTYFYQNLDSVPRVQELYCRNSEETVQDIQLGDTSFPKDYYLGLEELMRRQDNFPERRNRFLDFLLAIHGEAYMEYSFAQKNYYFKPHEFETFLITNKTRFLRHLPSINKNRVRAFNYLRPLENIGNLSGLEAKISILLGLDYIFQDELMKSSGDKQSFFISRKSSILDVFNQKNIKIIEDGTQDSRLDLWMDISRIGLTPETIQQNFDFVDEEDILALEDNPELDEKVLSQTAISQLSKVQAGFLRDGLNIDNYLIGQIDEEKSDFYLIFQYPEIQKWLLIAEFKSYEAALRGCKAFVSLVRMLNMQSEGFYLLEHLLLRPDVRDEKFGFYLLDEEGNNFLRSTKRYDFATRIKKAQMLKEYVEKSDKEKELYENFVVVQRDDNKEFEIRFKSEQVDVELVSQSYPSVQEIHKKLDKLYEFIADKEGIIPFEDKIAFYIQYESGKEPIPEDFFNYNISVLFPKWTARFHNREFKAMVENLVHENKPACVRAKVLWLNTEQMRRFESLYEDWSNKKQKRHKSHEENSDKPTDEQTRQEGLNRLNHHFLEFLFELHAKNS